jgi:hypothetical protein
MGATRSGKSTAGIAIAKLLGHITKVPFELEHICPNEILYLQKIKKLDVLDGSSYLIDEQTETHIIKSGCWGWFVCRNANLFVIDTTKQNYWKTSKISVQRSKSIHH